MYHLRFGVTFGLELVFILLCATAGHANTPIAIAVPDGFATLNGGTTGGGNATPAVVTTAAQFKNLIGGTTPRVIVVQGRINLGSSVTIGSNKTIIGADTTSGLYGGAVRVSGRNYIFQNLTIGPNTGGDAMELSGATNVFIHKCEFYDGADGSLDIVRESDWVTVSWCKFYYVDQITHRNTILIGNSDDRTSDRGKLHVTMHHNWFAEKCDQRLPRVRYGTVHIYNTYYNSVGSSYCIGTGVECQIRLENSHFDNVDRPWRDYLGMSTGGYIGWSNIRFTSCEVPTYAPNAYATAFVPPYTYTMDPVNDVKSLVTDPIYGAGNRLDRPSSLEAPTITSTAPIDAHVGEIYSYHVQASGYPAATFSLTNYPAGMTINAATGLIAWTPAAVGDYDITVVAANSEGFDEQTFTITAMVPPNESPTITSTPPATAMVGRSYSYNVQASGYPAATFSLSDHPAGMTINAATGLIEWTPTEGGFFDVSVVAANVIAPDAVQLFTIQVSLTADFVLRLNVNGPTVVDGDVTWESDDSYGLGGNLYTFQGTVDTTHNNIQYPVPTDGIYKSVRYHDHSFAIPVPQSGDYLVRMHWVDYHTDVRSNYYDIEGVRVLENFDPKNYGGTSKAVALEFEVTVTDGVMNIVAGKASGKGAITSAIEIMALAPEPVLIYGTVANVLGVPVAGVLVTAQNGGTDTTDASGYYEVLVPYGWSNTLTATRKDYSFVSPTLVLPATADQVGNFAAQLNADLDNSGVVDLLDLRTLCSNWLTAGDLITGDLDGNGFIDLLDFSKMAEYWLDVRIFVESWLDCNRYPP